MRISFKNSKSHFRVAFAVITRHGIHVLEQAAKIGLGSREYQIISLDKK